MKRNQFLKSVMVGAAGLSIPAVLASSKKEELDQVGFEHIPKENHNKMNAIIHRAETRGNANHGWLVSYHTFSFANYMNKERMHFGALRVLNDDIIQGGTGFGTHPHQNMEIVTIPLTGALEHKDSTGRHRVIESGDVQIMSAGKGIYHSEYNNLKDKSTSLLQIWVFPKLENIEPRYDQKTFRVEDRLNAWQTVVAPDVDGALWINQDAWFNLAELKKGRSLTYTKRRSDSVLYLFVIDGVIKVDKEILNRRDGMGISEGTFDKLMADENAQVLLMEIPKI